MAIILKAFYKTAVQLQILLDFYTSIKVFHPFVFNKLSRRILIESTCCLSATTWVSTVHYILHSLPTRSYCSLYRKSLFFTADVCNINQYLPEFCTCWLFCLLALCQLLLLFFGWLGLHTYSIGKLPVSKLRIIML